MTFDPFRSSSFLPTFVSKIPTYFR
jgi:hypothetical protein